MMTAEECLENLKIVFPDNYFAVGVGDKLDKLKYFVAIKDQANGQILRTIYGKTFQDACRKLIRDAGKEFHMPSRYNSVGVKRYD